MASKRKYWLACGVAMATLPPVTAAAQPRSINIPSEEAAKSIPEFARQENIQIIAPVSQLHGIKTQAVSGSMEMDAALNSLLVGTGLEVASNDGTTIVLRRAATTVPVIEASDTADAGPAPSESIVVTGSRVISDAANSPTPLTMVSAEQLRATTPTNLPDGLNKLPIFQGSQQIGRAGDGSVNFASNVLNLRNFGVQRTLILLDGHRAPPSNSDGTVDIDTLPQMLVSGSISSPAAPAAVWLRRRDRRGELRPRQEIHRSQDRHQCRHLEFWRCRKLQVWPGGGQHALRWPGTHRRVCRISSSGWLQRLFQALRTIALRKWGRARRQIPSPIFPMAAGRIRPSAD